MHIFSYNVNGIRAAMKKGLNQWFADTKPDILCIQETKAQPEQIDTKTFEQLEYFSYWHSAKKRGYSGVGLITKQKPDFIEIGMKIPQYDNEGRLIRADFGDITLINVYIPSGSGGDMRQTVKMQFLDDFLQYLQKLKKQRPNLIVSGDFNICHKPIDIHNPQSNKKTSGFLPEEREWMDTLTDSGFIDSFRLFNQEPHNYSWWTYRANARQKNKGWRIDYNMVSRELKERVQNAAIHTGVYQSDHCPVSVEVN